MDHHEMQMRGRCAVGMIVLSMAVYTATRYHGVPGGDSGELMAMACAGGVPHPPGYPLLTMLGRLWLAAAPSSLGSPASRLSLLSCFLGSLSAGVLVYAASEVSSSLWEAFLAAGFYAFSPITWNYSTQYEVFALNNLFSSCLLYLSLRYIKHTQRWIAFTGAFLCGLALTNQHTIALLQIPLVLSVLIRSEGSLVRPIPLLFLVFLFGLGLVPYAYLPVHAKDPPLGSWGAQDSLEGFLRHLLRKEYGTFQLYTTGSPTDDAEAAFDGLGNLQRQTWLYLASLLTEAMYSAPVLCTLGIVTILRESKAIAAMLLSAFLLYVFFFFSLANLPEDDFFSPILSRFWMQLNQLAFLALSCGARVMLQGLQGPAPATPSLLRPLLCTSLVALQIAMKWGKCNKAGNHVIDQFARDQLASIPRKAIALCSGDLNYYPLLYLQQCEGLRRDVLPLNTAMIKGEWFTAKQRRNYPSVTFPGEVYAPAATHCSDKVYNLRCFLDANLKAPADASGKQRKSNKKRRRVVLLRKYPPGDDSHEGLYTEWPHGLAREVVGAGAGAPSGRAFERWLNTSFATLPPLEAFPARADSDADAQGAAGRATEGGWGEEGREKPGSTDRGAGGKTALDNWERVAVDEYVAAHTAMSKFLISALRDEAAARGIAANHSGVAQLAVEVSLNVVRALPSESVPIKNLGALHQHLMNVVVGQGFVPGGGDAPHMGRMVWAYERFVRVATANGEDDPDVAVLRDWTAQVRGWMQEKQLLHHIPSALDL